MVNWIHKFCTSNAGNASGLRVGPPSLGVLPGGSGSSSTTRSRFEGENPFASFVPRFTFVSRSPSLSRHLGVIPTVSVTRINMH